MREPKNWRRKLKDGGVEYCFSDGASTMKGSVAPAHHAEELQRIFEQGTGASLPEVEWKPQRGSAPYHLDQLTPREDK